MSEEASKKTFASKHQNKGEHQKPQHSGYKMNYGPSANGIYGHTVPHMYNPMAVHIQKGQAENTVNESNMSGGNFSAAQPQVSHQPVVKTANTHTDALQRKLELVAKIAQKNAAAKKAKEEEAAAVKKAEEEAAAKKAEEEAAAAKKAEEEAAAAKKAEEEAASKATEAPVEETTEAAPAEGSKRLPSQTKSFASRFAQSSQENRKSNSFNNNSPNGLGYPPLVPEPGIPVSVWLDHMKNIPDDESKGRVYTFEDIFELSQYKVVRDEAWHKKLGENRLFQLPYKKHSDKKKSSYNNDSKRGDNRKNDSKRNKSKRNGDKYGNKYDNNYSKVPSKGLGLANSEEEAAARKKAEEEEAERLANIPKITTSEKGWKSKKKSQAQVVNIVTESGEEILSPDETEKQLKSLLNKLTAENYASVSVKIINIMNQSRFKEDKLKSITKTIEMTIFKGCDESQWGKIYARLIGDCMKNIDPGCLPLFKEYYIKAEKYKRYDKEEEWEEQGIPKSEWPPFDPAKETEDFAPHVPINYFLDIEMLKYDITGDSNEDIWNVKEGEEEETVEMMSDEYYKAIGKKRRYLGLYRIIGHLYNINALLFDFINREFISLVRNIAEASKKGVVKDDVIEALLEFVTTISAKYTEYCKASGIANSLDVILTLGNTLFTDKKISSRMAFKFEEYSNQRLTNPSGTQDNEVKSLEEVRIEAMREIQRKKREEKQKVQDFRNNSRNNKSSRNGRGNDRGFGSNRNQSFKNNNSNNNGNWNTSGHSNNGSKNDSKTFVRSSSKKAEEPPKQSIKNAFEMLSNDSD